MTHEPVRYIDALTARYDRLGYPSYRWFAADSEPPLTPVTKPLAQSRVGMLTTSGCYVAGQVAYHYKDDTSIRRIPMDTPKDRLRFAHFTENYLVDARRDPDCLVPLTALRRLRDEGVVGSLADDVISCMGGVYSQRRVREEMVPQIAAAFTEQRVDLALLVPM
jgi:D-proline reductase (dithiol) PrdB